MDQRAKRLEVLAMVNRKKAADRRAHEITLKLIETNVEKEYLFEKAALLSPHHLEDVVEERNLTKACGWTLCDNVLMDVPKQKYVIRGKKVLDITERKCFCCAHCYATYIHFKSQMSTSPVWLRGQEPDISFSLLESKDIELHGITVKLQTVDVNYGNKEAEKKITVEVNPTISTAYSQTQDT